MRSRKDNRSALALSVWEGRFILIPWMILGASMGVGYFGLETLLCSWYNNNRRRRDRTTLQNNPWHRQILRHLQQIGGLLSSSESRLWCLRHWSMNMMYRDIMVGVVIAVLPSVRDTKTVTSGGVSEGAVNPAASNNTSRGFTEASAAPEELEGENNVFLTLPPQLHTRLPPKAPKAPQQANKKERYLELLLHNVSHTDLVLGLDVDLANNNDTQQPSLKSMCLCRPRFSTFDMYCRKLLQALEQAPPTADIILIPQFNRTQDDPRYTIQPSDRPHMAAGFCWKQSTNHRNDANQNTTPNPRFLSLAQALSHLRVRGKDMTKLDPYITTSSDNRSSPPSPAEKEDTHSSPTTSSWNLVSSTLDPLLPTPKTSNQTTSAATPSSSAPRSKDDILVELKAIFFPLLATLLPRWHAQIADKFSHQWHSHEITKVLVLVTGVGTPRNWTHSITGNSTQALADLMELFLAKVYPDITVVKIHSDTNIFRYDDNILFVQQELLPRVNAYRDAHATQSPYPHESNNPAVGSRDKLVARDGTYARQLQPYTQSGKHNTFDVDWKKSFAVTLSFADGSPARTHAIQTSLRIFRPTYFHIWQLKTFWHERKIVDDDVEVHSFEEMETSPAMESSDMQGELDMVVQEMKAFRDEMTDILLHKDASDIHSFWLRKTHKAVLAVLLVQNEGGPPILYRGTNMEVSMPTGSLCAERNVIGTALASNPKLKRQDLKCIAVLAVPQPSKEESIPRAPRSTSLGSTSENNAGVGSKGSRHNSIDESKGNTSTMTGRQMRGHSFDEREEDWTVGSDGSNKSKSDGNSEHVVLEADGRDRQPQNPGTPLRKISLFTSESSNSLVDMIKQNPMGSSAGSHPLQKPKPTSSSTLGAAGKERRNVIVRSNNHDVDLNPLRPCGACHEWLKKIAECNPYFQIMTFTDADCNGVYCTPCQE